MSPTASQITSLTIVYLSVYSGADQRKHQSFDRWPLTGEFPAQRPVMRKYFHLMTSSCLSQQYWEHCDQIWSPDFHLRRPFENPMYFSSIRASTMSLWSCNDGYIIYKPWKIVYHVPALHHTPTPEKSTEAMNRQVGLAFIVLFYKHIPRFRRWSDNKPCNCWK